MDRLSEMFFENPVRIYVALGAVEAVVLIVWVLRRTQWWGRCLLIAPVVAVAVGLMAHFVQTDREQIRRFLTTSVVHVEAGDADAAAACLDNDFSVPGPLGQSIPREVFVEYARVVLRTTPLEKIVVHRLDTQVDGRKAATELVVTIVTKSMGGVRNAKWRIDWVERDKGWRIIRLQAVEPDWLAKTTMRP